VDLPVQRQAVPTLGAQSQSPLGVKQLTVQPSSDTIEESLRRSKIQQFHQTNQTSITSEHLENPQYFTTNYHPPSKINYRATPSVQELTYHQQLQTHEQFSNTSLAHPDQHDQLVPKYSTSEKNHITTHAVRDLDSNSAIKLPASLEVSHKVSQHFPITIETGDNGQYSCDKPECLALPLRVKNRQLILAAQPPLARKTDINIHDSQIEKKLGPHISRRVSDGTNDPRGQLGAQDEKQVALELKQNVYEDGQAETNQSSMECVSMKNSSAYSNSEGINLAVSSN